MTKIMPRPAASCRICDLKPGDAIAFGPIPGDWKGAVISLGTWPWWPLSRRIAHFAMIVNHDGCRSVLESTIDPVLGDCLDAARIVEGVQVHELQERMRIHLVQRKARAWRLPFLHDPQGIRYGNLLGRPYDLRGALRSRDGFLGWRRWLFKHPPHADRRLFCSEVVLLVYLRLALLPLEFPYSHYNPKAAAHLLDARGICGPPEEIRL